jgi:hypothetical protein
MGVFFGSIMIGLTLVYFFLDPKGNTQGDVRYIKTRNISKDPKPFDAVIIGSSRVYDAGDISDCNYTAFNYGFIQAVPSDFPEFIAFTKQKRKLKKIILGLDFYGSSEKGLSDFTSTWKESKEYIDEVENQTIYSKIISLTNFGRFKRLVNYKILGNDPFDRQQVDTASVKTSDTWNKLFWGIYENAYNNYIFNDSIEDVYKQIKESVGDTELIVYITPESEPLIDLMENKDLADDYEKFLKATVNAFDTVYNLMEVNTFTSNPRNFKDESHLTNDKLHDILCNFLNGNANSNTGTVLTRSNIDSYIEQKGYK